LWLIFHVSNTVTLQNIYDMFLIVKFNLYNEVKRYENTHWIIDGNRLIWYESYVVCRITCWWWNGETIDQSCMGFGIFFCITKHLHKFRIILSFFQLLNLHEVRWICRNNAFTIKMIQLYWTWRIMFEKWKCNSMSED
jgi:hypothetical protein